MAVFRVTSGRREGETAFEQYLGNLVKMIPAPALGLYLAAKPLIPSDYQGWWAALGIVFVFIFRIWGTADRAKRESPQWVAVIVATVAYIIWVYAMGDQIATFTLAQGWVASVAVLVWSGLAPIFYKGDPA